IKRAHRYGTPMSVVMFDIDHFKNVNDDFGHDIGDRVLQNLAHEVQHQLRDTDKLCRVGGEEFCILMPETHIEGAVHIAERLSHTISNLSLTDIPRQVTISIGVTELNRWDNEMSIYKRVDIALYKAKNDGRNRIEVLND
ncbi:MAG: GGDEF domain-containing protein, partial [Hydrogenovibrio sp.]|nr:GGDEF domain-containing protein [Hydrogenovibrio sp.]